MKKDAIDIENGYKPKYVVVDGKEKVINDIKKRAKKADSIFLATDPDREGEAIAWHIKDEIGIDRALRVTFNEITEEAVKMALDNPTDIDLKLKESQEARRILDRLFGYTLSRLIWQKVRYGLSAGRVQSPALRILMERERMIRDFKPEKYWSISGLFKNKKDKFLTKCKDDIFDEKLYKKILKEGKESEWIVSEVKKIELNKNPYPPFTTSTLQQAASSRLGISPSQTMRFAQKLYEAGHITYMRTDSTNLSNNAHNQIEDFVVSKFGGGAYQRTDYKTKKKSAQEAHETIRPTSIKKTTAGNSVSEKRLYQLIRVRCIASQMVSAVLSRTTIKFKSDNKEIPEFTITGTSLKTEGWYAIDPDSRGEDVILPEIKKGTKVDLLEIISEEKETSPPNRFSEAGLIKELEKRDIGRPSTYASIIKTLVDRMYVEKSGRILIPTDTGDVVSSFLEKHFQKIYK